MKKQNGFSLVEVLVASVIFAIAATGLFSTFSPQRVNSDRSERRLQAAYLGRQLLEELRTNVDLTPGAQGAPSWADFTCDGVSHEWPYDLAGNPLIDDRSGGVDYTCTTDASGLRQFSLVVTWNEP